MSNSPLAKNSNNQDQPDIQFTTGNIGRWASQQEDPFAEQNRQRATKKQQRNAKRQKAAPIVVITTGVILTAAAVVGLVFLIIHLVNNGSFIEAPEIAGSTTQDISDYRDILQNFYNQRPDATEEEKLQAIQNAVNGTLSTTNGRDNEEAVKVAQIIFYVNNGLYEEADRTAASINEAKLDLEQKVLYYGTLYTSATRLGKADAANEYLYKLYEASEELGGVGGGN